MFGREVMYFFFVGFWGWARFFVSVFFLGWDGIMEIMFRRYIYISI